MQRIFLLISMFFGAVSATMASSVDVTYSEETELVGIVSHLADIPGHNFEEDVLPDYLSEVDSVFAGYRNHEVVKFAREKLMGEGFNWHFPMAVALRLKITDGKIVYDNTLVPDHDNYYDRISRQNEQRFVSFLQDFYEKTNFHSFYESHRALYSECEAAMRKVVDEIDFGWYDRFFGPRENSEFRIYLAILIGPGNYSVSQKHVDGSETVNAVMGCCSRDDDGRIYYGIHYTLPIIIHECNHSYCNALNAEFWKEIETKATEVYKQNAKFYESIAYGDPRLVMDETFVEASVVRYLMSHPIDMNGYTLEDWIKMDEEDKKFVMIRDVIRVLDERERLADKYPTMRSFMPRYVETVNSFQSSR